MRSDVAKILLVGPGRAGRAFARSWIRAGGEMEFAARDAARARAAAESIPGTVVRPLDGAPLAADAVALAVPDDAIRSLATDLAGRVECRYAFHFSGALAADAISPLATAAVRPGAQRVRLGSMHPLRAFTGSPDEDWRGAFIAVEGDDAALEAGAGIARQVGARPHTLRAEMKPLYHAAATLAAGGTASLVSAAVRVWSAAGLEEDEGRIALGELAATAVEAVVRRPFAAALTGPVARRDVETLRLHAASLRRLEAASPGGLEGASPGPLDRDGEALRDAVRLYAMLARETLRRTGGGGRESEITALLDRLLRAAGPAGPPTDENRRDRVSKD